MLCCCPWNTDWLEMPGSLILLLVVAPNIFAHTLRDSWIGTAICLLIGCYLLQEHIRASGGFRNSFTQSNGISNTVGIVLLLVYPIWALLFRVVWWTIAATIICVFHPRISMFNAASRPLNKWIWFCLNISGYVIMFFWHIKYLWLMDLSCKVFFTHFTLANYELGKVTIIVLFLYG